MARLTRDQIKKAISQQRPAYEVVEGQPDADAARTRDAAPDAVSPDLEQAAKRYGSDAERPARGHPSGDDDRPNKRDDTLVVIRPKDATTDRMGAGPKQVILDSDGEIIAEQG